MFQDLRSGRSVQRGTESAGGGARCSDTRDMVSWPPRRMKELLFAREVVVRQVSNFRKVVTSGDELGSSTLLLSRGIFNFYM